MVRRLSRMHADTTAMTGGEESGATHLRRSTVSLAFAVLAAAVILATILPAAAPGGAPARSAAASPARRAPDAHAALADASGYRTVNTVGGHVWDAALAGDTAYVPVGQRLYAFDVSDPAAPLERWRSEPLPAVIHTLAVADGRAYLVTADNTLHVLEAGTDASRELGRLALSCNVHRLVVAATHAFLTCGPSNPQLLSVDVSDPAAMREGTRDGVPGLALARLGHHVVAGGDEELVVFDTADPSAPQQVSALPLRWSAYGVAALAFARVGERDILVAVIRGWLTTYDLADDGTLAPLGETDAPGSSALSIAAVGAHVLAVAPQSSRVTVFSIEDPSAPEIVSTVDRPTRPIHNVPSVVRADASTGRAVMTDGAGVAQLVDVTAPAAPVLGETLGVPRTPTVFAAADGAWFATDAGGLCVLDGTAPSVLPEIGRLALAGETRPGTLHGEIAYVPTGRAGLAIVDVSDPRRPELVTTLPPDEPQAVARLVETAGDRLYLATGQYFEVGVCSLRVFDIGDPRQPTEMGRVPLEDPPSALWAAEDDVTVYTAPGAMIVPALVNVDVSDPAGPTVVLRLTDWRWAGGFARDREIAYIGAGFGQFEKRGTHVEQLDVSAPTTATLRAEIDVGGSPTALAWAGDVLWAGILDADDGSPRITRLDVSDPDAPRIVDGTGLSDRALSLAFVDGHVLAVTADAGLVVLEPPRQPVGGRLLLPWLGR